MDKATSVRQKPTANTVKTQSNESKGPSAKESQKPSGDGKRPSRNVKAVSGGRATERNRETSTVASNGKAAAPARAHGLGQSHSPRETGGPAKASANMVLLGGSAGTTSLGPSVSSGLSSAVGPLESMRATFTDGIAGATQHLRSFFGAMEEGERPVEDSAVQDNVETASDSRTASDSTKEPNPFESANSTLKPQPAPPANDSVSTESVSTESEIQAAGNSAEARGGTIRSDVPIGGVRSGANVEGQGLNENIVTTLAKYGVPITSFEVEPYLGDMVTNQKHYHSIQVTPTQSIGTKRIALPHHNVLDVTAIHSRNPQGRERSRIVGEINQNNNKANKALFDININHKDNQATLEISSSGRSYQMPFVPFNVIPQEINSAHFASDSIVGLGDYGAMTIDDGYQPTLLSDDGSSIQVNKSHGQYTDSVTINLKKTGQDDAQEPENITSIERLQTNTTTDAFNESKYDKLSREYTLTSKRPIQFSGTASQPSESNVAALPAPSNKGLSRMLELNPDAEALPPSAMNPETQRLMQLAASGLPPTTQHILDGLKSYTATRNSDGTTFHHYSDAHGGKISSLVDANDKIAIIRAVASGKAGVSYTREYDFREKDPKLTVATSNIITANNMDEYQNVPVDLEPLLNANIKEINVSKGPSKFIVNAPAFHSEDVSRVRNLTGKVEEKMDIHSLGDGAARIDTVSTYRPLPRRKPTSYADKDVTDYLGVKITEALRNTLTQVKRGIFELGSGDRDWDDNKDNS
jgi:hypothetical protein